MNEDWACPQCGRDDYRCKCELPYPAVTPESYARDAHRRCHWPSETSVGQDEAEAWE